MIYREREESKRARCKTQVETSDQEEEPARTLGKRGLWKGGAGCRQWTSGQPRSRTWKEAPFARVNKENVTGTITWQSKCYWAEGPQQRLRGTRGLKCLLSAPLQKEFTFVWGEAQDWDPAVASLLTTCVTSDRAPQLPRSHFLHMHYVWHFLQGTIKVNLLSLFMQHHPSLTYLSFSLCLGLMLDNLLK